MSTKTVRPANAGAITRLLASAGLRKSETHSTAVRGYTTSTEGVSSTQVMQHGRTRVRQGSYRDGSPRYGTLSNNTPTGYVEVTYTMGRWSSRDPEVPARALQRAAEVLRSKGYEVEMTSRGMSEMPLLLVCRKDADGNVVRF